MVYGYYKYSINTDNNYEDGKNSERERSLISEESNENYARKRTDSNADENIVRVFKPGI